MNRKAISSGFPRASLTMTAVLLLLFLSAQPLRAQVDTGTLLGTVTDASGAPVNGAKVTLTNEGTSAHARQNRDLQAHGVPPRIPDHDANEYPG